MDEKRENEWLSLKEVAKRLGLTTNTIYKLCHTGELRAARVGRQWRIRRSDVEALAPDEQVSISEAASILGISNSTVYRFIEDGKLPAIRVGGQYRIRKKYLESFVTGQPEARARLAAGTEPALELEEYESEETKFPRIGLARAWARNSDSEDLGL
jgi:excisionase family DNA binding protein